MLGRVGEKLLGGKMHLDVAAARKAIEEKLAVKLNMTVEEVAEGILRVANSNMVRAIRVMTVERGIDPRKFVLLPYGGAGALHAVELARTLDIGTVVIPIAPGNFSAFGVQRFLLLLQTIVFFSSLSIFGIVLILLFVMN